MPQSANDLDSLNGLFKEIYADKIEKLIPDGVKLVKKVEFVSKDKQPGNFYNQPVILGMEHGVTFAAEDSGAFNLNAPVAGQMKNASVRGSQLVLRSVLAYSAASRAAGGGNKAFVDATKLLVQNMLDSVSKKLEIELLYGQMGYGTVASVASNTITITTAEFAPGIWAGAEGMPIEIRDSTGATVRGQANITAVDVDARTITVDSLPAGTVATDVIWHRGAYGNEFAGVHKILSNSSSLFGIDASAYNLWKGSAYSAGSAALSFAKVQKAVARGVNKGLEEDSMLLVSASTWADLLNDQAGLRRYDASYKKESAPVGAKAIEYYGQNGMIEIMPSIYVKEGSAYLLAPDQWLRVGSTDVTFRRPGQGEEFFRELENAAGYELRCYTDQAAFCVSPAKNVLISGIVNAS